MYPLWEKAAKGVCNLLNIVLKSRLCVCDAGADGSGRWIFCFGPPQINQHMGNTDGVLTVLEHTAVRNA